jgi:hypothetical protein
VSKSNRRCCPVPTRRSSEFAIFCYHAERRARSPCSNSCFVGYCCESLFGKRTKSFRAADAPYAPRREGSRRFIQNQLGTGAEKRFHHTEIRIFPPQPGSRSTADCLCRKARKPMSMGATAVNQCTGWHPAETGWSRVVIVSVRETIDGDTIRSPHLQWRAARAAAGHRVSASS